MIIMEPYKGGESTGQKRQHINRLVSRSFLIFEHRSTCFLTAGPGKYKTKKSV